MKQNTERLVARMKMAGKRLGSDGTWKDIVRMDVKAYKIREE